MNGLSLICYLVLAFFIGNHEIFTVDAWNPTIKYRSDARNRYLKVFRTTSILKERYADNEQPQHSVRYHSKLFHSSSDFSNLNNFDKNTYNWQTGESNDLTNSGDEVLDDRFIMLKELYWDLCEGNSYLTKQKFMDWEDVQDLLKDGTFDNETMDVIFEQVEVGP